jgi:sugar lactone lactonase YvrE
MELRRTSLWAPLLAAVLAGGLACASGPPPEPGWRRSEVRRVWPEPPDPARIEYVGALREPADLGRRLGWLERVKAVLFGTEPMPMLRPIAVAKNERGVLVVADPSIPAVHRFDLEGREYRKLGEDLDPPLLFPVGVAIDEAGRIYVADSRAGSIRVLDAQGRALASMGQDQLQRPAGLALTPDQQHLYVVDVVACRVLVFDRDGRLVHRFGRRGSGPGEFNAPTFVAVGLDGTVSVADSLNFRVQRFQADGTHLGSFGRAGDATGHFSRPKGVGTDSEGRLYVADAGFENVQIFSPDGRLLLPFGGPGTGPGEFVLPGGVFLDRSNTIWVADSFNQRVQVFRLLGGGS